MHQHEFLAAQFEANRRHLRAVAFRMLGSLSEAEDAVQEAWLRLGRADTSEIGNFGGWLTTVVARVCLDALRARKSRREEPLDEHVPEPVVARGNGADPEQEMLMADSVGIALLVVLQILAPAERIAFVLHDMFDLPFEEIAAIVGRSPMAARQLASRARRRVQGRAEVPDANVAAQRKVVDAFLAASRSGDVEGLLAVLDPDVVVRADRTAMRLGASRETRGAAVVARFFQGRAQAARTALVNSAVGAVVAPRGRLLLVLEFKIVGGRIAEIETVADPDRLDQLELAVLDG